MEQISQQISAWRGWWIILRKEVKDNIRDRRTLTTMAISVILGPLLLFGFLWFAEKTVKEETDPVNSEAVQIPVHGADKAPNLIAWLEQNNIEVIAAPENSKQSIIDGELRVVLIIEQDYREAFQISKPAPVTLLHDSSISGLEKIGFETVKRAINAYSQQIGSLRLMARGVSPDTIQAIQVNISDVASPQARNAQIISIMPYLVIMLIMAGGMYLAIDTTAGEREKGSLEPLLTQPLRRHTVLLAKLSATIVFSAATFLLALIGIALAFNYAPIDSITIDVDFIKTIQVFIFCLPFVFVGCSLMVLIASYTKSHKEAQSYLSMVMLVPSLPLVVLSFLSPEPSASNMWVPSLSQSLIMIETLKGEQIDSSLILLSVISSLTIAALVSWLAIKLYQRERILG